MGIPCIDVGVEMSGVSDWSFLDTNLPVLSLPLSLPDFIIQKGIKSMSGHIFMVLDNPDNIPSVFRLNPVCEVRKRLWFEPVFFLFGVFWSHALNGKKPQLLIARESCPLFQGLPRMRLSHHPRFRTPL